MYARTVARSRDVLDPFIDPEVMSDSLCRRVP